MHLERDYAEEWHLRRSSGSVIPGFFLHCGPRRADRGDHGDSVRLPHDLSFSQKKDEKAKDTKGSGGVRARQLQSQNGEAEIVGQAVHHGATPAQRPGASTTRGGPDTRPGYRISGGLRRHTHPGGWLKSGHEAHRTRTRPAAAKRRLVLIIQNTVTGEHCK